MIESHPEVAFWRLNGGAGDALAEEGEGPGQSGGHGGAADAARRASAFDRHFSSQTPPRGAAADDFLDAAALLFIAARHARGEAQPFPDPPGVDEPRHSGRDLGLSVGCTAACD